MDELEIDIYSVGYGSSGISIWREGKTNNFSYRVESYGEIWEGTIYNYKGNYLDLIARVIDGRTVLRKD